MAGRNPRVQFEDGISSSDEDLSAESSEDESSDDEETAEKKRMKMAIWERPKEVYKVLECGGYMVEYKDYMLEKPPSYYGRMRPEFQMFSLRSRVIKYREEVLTRMVRRLEDKLTAREEELDGLDSQKVIAGDPAKQLYVVQTNIFHEPYEMTYSPGAMWREEEWLERHEHAQSFPQALEVEQARVLLLERVVAFRKEVTASRKELSSIGKFAGDAAATHVQKVMRSFLGRAKAAEKRRTYLIDRQIRAIGKIQRVWRGYISRVKTWAKFEGLNERKRWEAAIQVQRIWRGWLAREMFKKLEAAFRRRLEHNKATKIQAWFRGTRGRKIAEIKKKVLVEETVEDDYLDSTVQIQKFVRGWLGRKKVVARKVEVKLNKRVKKLAYDYISKGSFWEFLGAVNNDYQRYNDQRQREEELASTFINQVMARREAEQQQAWDSWNEQKKKMVSRGKGAIERANRRAMQKYLGSNDEEFFKKTMEWANKKKGLSSSKQRRPRASIEDGSRVQLDPLLSTTMTWNNSVLGSREHGGPPSNFAQTSLASQGGSAILEDQMSQHSVPGPGTYTPEASAVVIGGVSVPAGFNVGGVSTATPYSMGNVQRSASQVGVDDGQEETSAQYASITSALEQESSIFEGMTQNDYERFPADVLTRDITNVDDDIDRLLLHAALRTYIPATSKAMSGEEAFEEFLRMPPGLLKVKRESECARFAQPYVKILKYSGFKTVRTLKRCSATQMTALGIPVALAHMLGKLMRQLFRSWQNVEPSQIAKKAVSSSTGVNLFLEASQSFDVPENLRTLEDSALSDNYGFSMDESATLPGKGNAVIKLGDARELQALWPYGDDANEMKEEGKTGSGFESAAALATAPPSRESMMRQIRPETAQTIDYGGESRPSTAFSSSISRPGTRGSLLSRGSILRPSTVGADEDNDREGSVLTPGKRPGTRGILRVSSAKSMAMDGGGLDLSSRPKTRDSSVPTPSSAVARTSNRSRPGTTGNQKLVPASPVRFVDDVIQPGRRERPATEGRAREEGKKIVDKRASLQLPMQHRPPYPSRPGTAGDMGFFRPGTGGSYGSRPSTSATVDFGFHADAHANVALDYDAAMKATYEGEITPRHREAGAEKDEAGVQEDGVEPNVVEASQGSQVLYRPPVEDRPSTAERLREKLTAPMKIQSLDEPFENMLVHAALQVYNPPQSMFETGAESFEYFLGELVSFPAGPTGEKQRRECVRSRTKAAFRWAQTFIKTFKSYDLYSLRDLMKLGRPLEAFGLPEELAEKIQAALQKHLPHATVAIGYDKRYQRSAMDALGRPPPPLPIKGGGEVMERLLHADEYFDSHTLSMKESKSMDERVKNAGFMAPRDSRKWPGSKLQPFPIQSLESDFGASLPPAKPITPTPLTSIAERRKFKCRYQGCDQMFSRQYTLQLHERTHLHAQDYYFWKQAPRVGGKFGNTDVASPKKGSYDNHGRFRMADKTGFGIQRAEDGGLKVSFRGKKRRGSRK